MLDLPVFAPLSAFMTDKQCNRNCKNGQMFRKKYRERDTKSDEGCLGQVSGN